jgi:hypothetical protein
VIAGVEPRLTPTLDLCINPLRIRLAAVVRNRNTGAFALAAQRGALMSGEFDDG